MTITAIETKTNAHKDIAKAVNAHKRNAVALFLSLCDYLDKAGMSDKQKERARNASAAVGKQMLKAKNALPADPSKLRMWVESAKQKLASIRNELATDKTHSMHCQRAEITHNLNIAQEHIDLFLAEYNEHKANVANAKAA